MADIGCILSKYTGASELSSLLESDKLGIYAAKTYLKMDGITDDYTALYNLINTTINGKKAEIWFKDGTVLIGSNITIPSNIKLVFLNGGVLKPSTGKVITGSNAKIEAGLTQIFDLSVSGSSGLAGTWDVDIAYVEWFGGILNGTADDTNSFIYLVNFAKNSKCTVQINRTKKLLLKSSVDARFIDINCYGEILIHSSVTGYGIMIGDTSSIRTPRNIFIASADGGSYSGGVPTVRITGLKNGNIKIDNCPYVQIYANVADSTTSSVAYSHFYFGNVPALHLYGAAGESWITENNFYDGRHTTIKVEGNYSHNNNRWIRPQLEGTTIIFETGDSNKMEDCRFEGTNSITFAAGTHSNIITQMWNSTHFNNYISPDPVVVDNGLNNIVTRTMNSLFQYSPAITINSDIQIINATTSYKNLRNIGPGFDKVKIENDFATIFETGLIPVNEEIGFLFYSDVAKFRPFIYVYDSNKKPITTAPGGVTFPSSSFNASGYYTQSANVSGFVGVAYTGTSVAYVKFLIAAGNASANTWFRYLTAYIVNVKNQINLINYFIPEQKQIVVSAAITSGFPNLGEVYGKTTSGTYQCTFRLDTTISTSQTSGNNTLVIASATGVNSGDIIGILLDDATTQWTSVNGAPVGTTVTLTNNLAANASSGNSIIIFRIA